MLKIPQRKKRKREKRSKDRRSHSRRRKESSEERQQNHLLALEIVKRLPRNTRDDIGKKYLCTHCNQHYCINHHKQEEFCRTCWWGENENNCCTKTAMGKTLTCTICGREKCQDLTNTKYVEIAEAQAQCSQKHLLTESGLHYAGNAKMNSLELEVVDRGIA